MNAAFAVNLIAASPRGHLLYISFANFLDKINNLRRGNIQAMVIRLEITALAANLAIPRNPLISKLLLLNPFINFAHPRMIWSFLLITPPLLIFLFVLYLFGAVKLASIYTRAMLAG